MHPLAIAAGLGLVQGGVSAIANHFEGRANRRAQADANFQNSIIGQAGQYEQIGLNRALVAGINHGGAQMPLPSNSAASSINQGFQTAINAALQMEQLESLKLKNEAYRRELNINTNNPVEQGNTPTLQGLSNNISNNGVTNGGVSNNGNNPNSVTVAHNDTGVASQWTPMQMFRKQLNGDLDLLVDKQTADSLESDKYGEYKHLINSLDYLGQGVIGIHSEDYMRAYRTLYEISLEMQSQAPSGFHFVPKSDLRGLRLVKNQTKDLPLGQGGFAQRAVNHYKQAKSYFRGK